MRRCSPRCTCDCERSRKEEAPTRGAEKARGGQRTGSLVTRRERRTFFVFARSAQPSHSPDFDQSVGFMRPVKAACDSARRYRSTHPDNIATIGSRRRTGFFAVRSTLETLDFPKSPRVDRADGREKNPRERPVMMREARGVSAERKCAVLGIAS